MNNKNTSWRYVFANTGFLQIVAQSAHHNIVGAIKQNKSELVLSIHNCIESIVTFLQTAVDAMDKSCDGWRLVFLSDFQFRTQSTKYLTIACRSTCVIYPLFLLSYHISRNVLKIFLIVFRCFRAFRSHLFRNTITSSSLNKTNINLPTAAIIPYNNQSL